MQQYIYYGGDFLTRDKQIKSDFDFAKFVTTLYGEDGESIKIETIRNLINDLSIKSERPRLVYVQDAALLTLPAQNSLLKTLEEPPENTTIIFSVNNLTTLIPTVRSRAKAINVHALLPTKNQESLALVKSAFKLRAGERIQIADGLGKDRDACLMWLESLISSLYQVMQETDKPSQLLMLAELSKLAVDARTDLTTNVNVGLTMQHFFLSLPQLKSL